MMTRAKRCWAVAVLGVAIAGCQVSPPTPTPSPPVEPTRPLPPPPPPPTPPAEPEPPRELPLIAPTSGGVAHYQNVQEQLLRARLDGTGIRVQRSGDQIKLVLPANASFAVSGDQLASRAAAALAKVVPVLKEFEKTTIAIKGYTDSVGSFEHNQQLSQRRAQSVGAFFTGQDISAARITTAGYGPRFPVADNRTDTGRALNRRVEIDLVPVP